MGRERPALLENGSPRHRMDSRQKKKKVVGVPFSQHCHQKWGPRGDRGEGTPGMGTSDMQLACYRESYGGRQRFQA